jgi:hypothetical protein
VGVDREECPIGQRRRDVVKVKEVAVDKSVIFSVLWVILSVVNVVAGFYGYSDWVAPGDLVAIVALLNAVVVIALKWFQR